MFYALFLGYRRDYLGHFAAGYGGTLCAITVLLAAVPLRAYRSSSSALPLVCTIVCIFAGAIAEGTVFRLAKFDEIDFCNQSLGAVLAGLAVSHLSGVSKPTDKLFTASIAIGFVFLVLGNYFALT